MAVHGPWLSDALQAYLSGATVKATLVDDTYVEDPDQHYRAEITQEVGATATASGVALSYDDILNQVLITCDPVAFGTLSLTGVGGVVFYVDNGSAATDVILVSDLFGSQDISGDFTYTPSDSGLIVAAMALADEV